MNKLFNALCIGIVPLVFMACESPTQDSIIPETKENVDVIDTGKTVDSTAETPASVEGIWIVEKEVFNGVEYSFSHTDTSKLLSNYLMVLHNDGTGFIKTFGVQFHESSIEIDTSIETSSFNYRTNDGYLFLDEEAFTYSFNNDRLELVSGNHKRTLHPFSGELPPAEWETENVLRFGFHKPSQNEMSGIWKNSSSETINFSNIERRDSWYFSNGVLRYTPFADKKIVDTTYYSKSNNGTLLLAGYSEMTFDPLTLVDSNEIYELHEDTSTTVGSVTLAHQQSVKQVVNSTIETLKLIKISEPEPITSVYKSGTKRLLMGSYLTRNSQHVSIGDFDSLVINYSSNCDLTVGLQGLIDNRGYTFKTYKVIPPTDLVKQIVVKREELHSTSDQEIMDCNYLVIETSNFSYSDTMTIHNVAIH